MPKINFTKRTLLCKVVYYGPLGAGCTTSLEFVHKHAPAKGDGQVTSITSAHTPFEFMPMRLGQFDGMDTTLHVYTVPHDDQAAVRQSILRDADVVIFVADSTPTRLEDNRRALGLLREDLRALGLNPTAVPLVMQWNKRDVAGATALEALESALNPSHAPSFATTATAEDAAVLATVKKASLLALEKVVKSFNLTKTQKMQRPSAAAIQQAVPVTRTAPAHETVRTPRPQATTARKSSSARLRALHQEIAPPPRAASAAAREYRVVGVTKRRRRLFSR